MRTSTVSVASHLAVSPSAYDRRIRRLLPHYDELLAEAACALHHASRPIRLIVDLGIGTGALTEACLAEAPGAHVVGFDTDPAMMAVAASRLRKHGSRIMLIERSFVSISLPPADAVVASYSLHHIRSTRAKLALYRRCHRTLRPGGVLISGDCMPASSPTGAARDLDAWLGYLSQAVGGRSQARRVYDSWADEDLYLRLAEEVRLLVRAGFVTDVPWRRSPFAVVVGVKRKP